MTDNKGLRMALRCMAQWSHVSQQCWLQGSTAYYCTNGVWSNGNVPSYYALVELIGSGLNLQSRRVIANAARTLREKGQTK